MAEPQPRDFGPYVLDKLISAEGGQGLVYLATHKALEKRVVIKILKDHLAKHSSFVERFASEAAQLARMDHANIVRVRQTGPMGEAFFIEMEFIEGWDLSSWLKEHGRLPVEIAVLVLQRFAAGLQHAHERSIIHRDVKPGNVMLTAAGEVKVLDFGLARDMDAEGRSTPGTLMGTYAYMSPEQVDGEEATIAFDVYALGVVAYQLLSNKIPFEGTIATVCMKIKNEEPAPLEKLCPEAPRALVKLVQRMMAKKPAQRPRDMREVEEGLHDIARHLGLRASEDLLPRYVADPGAAVRQIARRRLQRRWRPYALGAAAAVLVIAAAAVATGWLSGRGPGGPPVPAPVDSAAVAPAVAEAPVPEPTLPAAAESLVAAPAPPPADTARARPAPPAVAARETTAAPPPVAAGVTAPAAGSTLVAPPAAVSTAWSPDSIVVDVSVKPAADLYLDGVRVASGVTRWTKRVIRKPWDLRVDAGEYGEREQKRRPRARDTVLSFDLDLSVGSGGVFVSGPRNGLDIYVDGVYRRAVTPAPVRPLDVGPHVVEVKDRGTGEVLGTRRIVVRDGPKNVEVDFTPGR